MLRVVYLQVGHSEQRQQGEGHQVEQSRLSSTMDPGGHGGSQQTWTHHRMISNEEKKKKNRTGQMKMWERKSPKVPSTFQIHQRIHQRTYLQSIQWECSGSRRRAACVPTCCQVPVPLRSLASCSCHSAGRSTAAARASRCLLFPAWRSDSLSSCSDGREVETCQWWKHLWHGDWSDENEKTGLVKVKKFFFLMN